MRVARGRRIAIGNNKGGSGKTSTTVNLAAALAEAGLEVGVADCDPQGNTSRRLAARADSAKPTISEVIQANRDGCAADALVPCGWRGDYRDRIVVLPSRFDLENRIYEAGTVGAVGRLARGLAGVEEHRIWLFDCPPSLGHLTQLALYAADSVLISVEPEYDAVDGAVRLRDFVSANAAQLGNPGLVVEGYVVSRSRPQLGAHQFQIDGLPELFGAADVWDPYVPERAVIKDAADAAIPLAGIAKPEAREMAAVYRKLAERVAERAGAVAA